MVVSDQQHGGKALLFIQSSHGWEKKRIFPMSEDEMHAIGRVIILKCIRILLVKLLKKAKKKPRSKPGLFCCIRRL
jgi:hypothetical protein